MYTQLVAGTNRENTEGYWRRKHGDKFYRGCPSMTMPCKVNGGESALTCRCCQWQGEGVVTGVWITGGGDKISDTGSNEGKWCWMLDNIKCSPLNGTSRGNLSLHMAHTWATHTIRKSMHHHATIHKKSKHTFRKILHELFLLYICKNLY